MKTGHLLFLSGMNREAFNTLRRRDHLAFLDKHAGKGSERYNAAHGLGVAAFAVLRRIGLEAAKAAEAVNDSWPDIMRIAGLSPDPVKSDYCGVRINDIGVEDTWGWPHPASKGGPPLARSDVNLRELWKDLQPQLRSLEEA